MKEAGDINKLQAPKSIKVATHSQFYKQAVYFKGFPHFGLPELQNKQINRTGFLLSTHFSLNCADIS